MPEHGPHTVTVPVYMDPARVDRAYPQGTNFELLVAEQQLRRLGVQDDAAGSKATAMRGLFSSELKFAAAARIARQPGLVGQTVTIAAPASDDADLYFKGEISKDTPADQRRPPYALRHLCRFPLGTPYPEVVRGVLDLLHTPGLKDVTLVVDQTGVGRAVVEVLKEALTQGPPCALWPVTITAGHGASLAEAPGASTPGLDECRRATYQPAGVPFSSLYVGGHLCVRTSQGNLSLVRVVRLPPSAPQASVVEIVFTTWQE